MSEPLCTSSSPEASQPAGSHGAARQVRISTKNVLWPLLLSLVVLGVIGYFTFETEGFKASVERLNPWYLVAAGMTIIMRVGFGAWRFSFISRGQLDFWHALRGQLAWDFFSNVTPAALGGGPFAALYVARDSDLQVGETSALVIFTILLDQLWSVLTVPIILLTAVFIPVIPEGAGTIGTVAIIGYFALMLLWVVLLGYATLYRPGVLERYGFKLFSLRFLRRFRKRVMLEMRQMSQSARILRAQPFRFFGKAFLLSAGTWIPRYLLPVFLVLSVLPSLDAVLFFLRSITMMVCAFVVPTPGGAGGIEGLYALFLGPMMPKSLVAPTLLMWRFFGYYVFVALGGFLFRYARKEAQARETDADPPSVGADSMLVPAQEHEPEFVNTEE